MERPIPEHDPPINHVDLIGRMLVRGIRTAQKEFFGRGRRSSPSNQRDLVGHVQGSDARFLLNQSVSDLAFRDFVPITFQGNFFGVKMKKKKNSTTITTFAYDLLAPKIQTHHSKECTVYR
jgi:hypothetical protein